MAKSIEAAKAFFKVYAEDSEFRRSVAHMQAQLKAAGAAVSSIGLRIGAAGAAIGAPLLAAAAKFASFGASIDDAAQRTGINARELSALGFAAEQSGTDLATLESGILRMEKALAGSRGETKGLATTLEGLGVSMRSLQGLSPDQQFGAIATAISKIDDPAKQTALAMEIFGKAGAKLAPLLKGGSAGIAALTAEAERLGVTIGDDQAAAAAALDDAWSALRSTLRGTTLQIGGALAPALTGIISRLSSAAAAVTAFIRQNQGIVTAVAILAGGLLAGGAALVAFGQTMIGVSAAVGVASTAMGAVGAVIAAVASPIGLVVAALAGAAAAWLTYADSGTAAADAIATRFTSFVGEIGQTMGLVGQLIANGEVGAAAKLLWEQLQAIWGSGTAGIKTTFAEWGTFALQVLIEARAQMSQVWLAITTFFQTTWEKSVASIAGTITKVGRDIRDIWGAAVNAVAGLLVRLRGLFDSSFNTDKALAELKAAAEEAKAIRDAEADSKLSKITADRDRQLAEIEAERKRAFEEIDQRRRQNTENNFAGKDDRLAAIEAELAKSRAAFAQQVDKAKDTIRVAEDRKKRDLAKQGAAAAAGTAAAAERSAGGGGTFEGQLAGLIFGGSGSGQDIPRKQLDTAVEQLRSSKRIEATIVRLQGSFV